VNSKTIAFQRDLRIRGLRSTIRATVQKVNFFGQLRSLFLYIYIYIYLVLQVLSSLLLVQCLPFLALARLFLLRDLRWLGKIHSVVARFLCGSLGYLICFYVLFSFYMFNYESLKVIIHSFLIWLAITLESMFSVQYWTHIARSLRRPNSIASYSAMLLLHLSTSTVNCSHAAYLSLMPEGDVSIAAAPASETPQAPSQYTCHDVSTTVPSV
jgi:hypothetical protein